jgi:hypothetical protein
MYSRYKLYPMRLMLLFFMQITLFLLPLSLQSKTLFPVGESYTFYLDSPSSTAKIITCNNAAPLSAMRLFLSSRLTGESTVYASPPSETSVTDLAKHYQATLLFQEESAGITSYYFYTPLFKNGVSLGGQTVNLHIAIRPNGTLAIGTPLLFGGF